MQDLYFISNKMNMIYLCSDAPKSMDIDKVKKEEKGVKKEKEEPKEGQVLWAVLT